MPVLEFEAHIDVVFPNCNSDNNPWITRVRRVKDIEWCTPLGYRKNSNTQLHLIDLEEVYDDFPEYDKRNVLFLCDHPYKSAANYFYSTLFISQYRGDALDKTLEAEVIPYLKLLLGSKMTIHKTLKNNYPAWSTKALETDWVRNVDVWQDPKLKSIADPRNLKRFNSRKKVHIQCLLAIIDIVLLLRRAMARPCVDNKYVIMI